MKHDDAFKESMFNISYCLRKTAIPQPWLSKNRDWVVNKDGIHHRKYDLTVEMEYVVEVHQCSKTTIHSFDVQPWPFWECQIGLPWLKDGKTYKEAFIFALGWISMQNWNYRAYKRLLANTTNKPQSIHNK